MYFVFVFSNFSKILEKASKDWDGGYVIAGMLGHGESFVLRDPSGIRPAYYYEDSEIVTVASERPVIQTVFDIPFEKIKELQPGRAIITKKGENAKIVKVLDQLPKKSCSFERIYFSRPDSLLDNKTAYEHRKNLGKELAKENDFNADIVVPVPDSGNAAALGFAQHLNVNYEHGLIRNHYVGRTFIEPSQKIRSLGVKLKLNANQTTIKDKKIILIDDSLVRGTTSHKIVKMLYDAGAKEVHVRIACPEIKHPDFYGVDTPTKKELLAANKNTDEICEYIGAVSYTHLTLPTNREV